MSPGRIAAVCSAAVVTLLTCGGALGFGPGAAALAATQTPPASTGSTGASGHTAADSRGTDSSTSGSGGWLAIDNGGSVAPGSTAPPDTSSGQQNPGNPGATQPVSGGQSSSRTIGLPSGSGAGKRIVYDISAQRVWLVHADDSVARTYLVSGGKDPSLLKPGDYRVYSKSLDAVSYNHKETMQYMVRFASGDHAAIGFHDIPARSDGTLVESQSELGTPASSGCIRQWITDARALWEFSRVHTSVVVTA
jgi:lipoprotein-anchoring transpeptidase ErfK/SrfK